jgi:hypothetical protein
VSGSSARYETLRLQLVGAVDSDPLASVGVYVSDPTMVPVRTMKTAEPLFVFCGLAVTAVVFDDPPLLWKFTE